MPAPATLLVFALAAGVQPPRECAAPRDRRAEATCATRHDATAAPPTAASPPQCLATSRRETSARTIKKRRTHRAASTI
jgi:hypothetical protein